MIPRFYLCIFLSLFKAEHWIARNEVWSRYELDGLEDGWDDDVQRYGLVVIMNMRDEENHR